MLIGITGGIGSGKSTVCRRLRQLGYAVYDTDSEAKRLMAEDEAVRQELVAAFGAEVYGAEGLNRQYLAMKVFQDPEARKQLNGIVHPAVRRDLKRWYKVESSKLKAGRGGRLLCCFVECAILFESGFDRLCDRTVLVTAPMELRFARCIMRDHTSAEALQQRINAQMSDEEKAGLVDYVINNDGTKLVSTLVEEMLARLV